MHSEIPFCPWQPTSKQGLFLECKELEVFFGGAAGGGKSVALLMAALQHVSQSGYAALIIRKDFPRLSLAGGLIPRSHEWFAGREPRWNHTRRQWQFPVAGGPPATITFGYLSRPLDKFRYASSEFQYIAFDELTDFLEDDYLFLFSRLRRKTSLDVPLRIRSASNPGGVGHLWVKERFIGGEPVAWNGASQFFTKHGRLYLPSRIADNEHLSEEEYRQSLLHLPAVARERLMNGDWSVQEQGLIQADSLRYYVEQPADSDQPAQMELLDPDGRILATIPEGSCRRFVTIDPAGTSAERTREAKGGTRSWTVMQVWDQPGRELSRFLILRHQVRRQVGFGELCDLIREVHRDWRPERIWIEGEKLGRAAHDSLQREVPIECLPPGVSDKSTRAGPLIVKLEKGEVFLPKHETTWRPNLEAELLAWTGDDRQTADQIDAAAYAAIVVRDHPSAPIRLAL
jgi:phage terminase large subunit-like protein